MIGIPAAVSAAMVCAVSMMPPGAGVASADSLNIAPQSVVKYDDLNLTTEDGAKVLYRRIRGAAETVCASYEGRRDLARQAVWRACYDQAMASAIKKIDNRRVTALYEEATGISHAG